MTYSNHDGLGEILAKTRAPEGREPEHIRLTKEVIFKIGRNVLFFQRLETLLKVTLPLVKSNKTGNASMPWKDVAALLASKNTFGNLVQKLKDSMAVDDTRAAEAYIGAVLEHRNDLVHHFLARPDGNLATLEQCLTALAHLDEQYRFSLPFASLVEQIASCGIMVLEEGEIHEWEDPTSEDRSLIGKN
ncbi:MAG: hypothetical protein JWR21_4373 [Herminiimonas sp.]|nr:hypothetical protein [Herminiimonas sp.]